MMNDLTLEEKHDLWADFIACSIAAVLLMTFLIVHAAVSAPEPEPERGCRSVSQLEIVEVPCK